MNGGELLLHSLQSVYRHARSSFIAIISVALALGFIFASLVVVDTTYATIRRAHEESVVGAPHDGSRMLSWNDPGEFEDSLFMAAMSLPSMAVGLFVVVAGANLSVSMRKAEMRSLKNKGCTMTEMRLALITDSVVLGVIAGIVALIIAWAVARVTFHTLLTMTLRYDNSLAIGTGDITVSGSTVIYAILLGVGLMFISWLGPSRRLAEMFSEQQGPKRSRISSVGLGPLLDVALIALSLASIIDILSGMRWSGSHGFDWYTGSLNDMFGAAGLLLFPAMPFMLTVGVARILTRKPIMLHKRIGRSYLGSEKGPGAIEEDPVDRKRAARACVLVALALTFGTFASVAMQSNIEHERATARFSVGADVFVEASYYEYYDGAAWNPVLRPDHLDDIGSIPGVTSSTLVTHFVPFFGNEYTAAVAIDPESYLATVRPDGELFGEEGSDELKLLDQSGVALVSERFAELRHTGVGADIQLKIMYGTFENPEEIVMDVSVVGTARDLPGMIFADVYMGYATTDSVMSKMNLTRISNGLSTIMVIDDEADPDAIVAQATTIVNGAGLSLSWTSTLQDEYAWIDAEWGYGALTDFVIGEYVYVLLVVVVGVSMVSYVSAVQARSRAADSKDPSSPRNSIAVESVSIVVLGALIGTAIAVLTAYLFFIVWEPVEDELLQREVVFTTTTIVLIAASFVCLIIAPLIGAKLGERAELDIPPQPKSWL